jgi:hypothetical protein
MRRTLCASDVARFLSIIEYLQCAWARSTFEVPYRADERDVGKSLWKVAQLLAGPGVDLLRKQTQLAPKGQQMIEEIPGAIATFDEDVITDEPQRAGRERALSCLTLAVRVAIEKTVLEESPLKVFDRGAHSRIGSVYNALKWKPEDGRVEHF